MHVVPHQSLPAPCSTLVTVHLVPHQPHLSHLSVERYELPLFVESTQALQALFCFRLLFDFVFFVVLFTHTVQPCMSLVSFGVADTNQRAVCPTLTLSHTSHYVSCPTPATLVRQWSCPLSHTSAVPYRSCLAPVTASTVFHTSHRASCPTPATFVPKQSCPVSHKSAVARLQ